MKPNCHYFLAIAAAFVCLSGGSYPLWAASYRLIALPNAPNSQFYPTSISINGEVAGVLVDGHFKRAAAVVKGKLIVFSEIASGDSTATGITATGTAAGFGTTTIKDEYWGTGCVQHAVVFDKRRLIDLFPKSHFNSYANAINNSGDVVGERQLKNLRGSIINHGFFYRDGVVTDIGTLGGEQSFCNAINSSGTAVGRSDIGTAGLERAYIWQNGHIRDLRVGDRHMYSEAVAISSSGLVVGDELSNGSSFLQIFMWKMGTTTAIAKGIGYFAHGVNSAGVIVGCNGSRAVTWKAGRCFTLDSITSNSKDWSLSDAVAINDVGQIAGYGLYKGRHRGFLLQPLTSIKGHYLR